MHPLTHPVEPHFVHLSWAVRKLTPKQARYIRAFYGEEILHQLEYLEHGAKVDAHLVGQHGAAVLQQPAPAAYNGHHTLHHAHGAHS